MNESLGRVNGRLLVRRDYRFYPIRRSGGKFAGDQTGPTARKVTHREPPDTNHLSRPLRLENQRPVVEQTGLIVALTANDQPPNAPAAMAVKTAKAGFFGGISSL